MHYENKDCRFVLTVVFSPESPSSISSWLGTMPYIKNSEEDLRPFIGMQPDPPMFIAIDPFWSPEALDRNVYLRCCVVLKHISHHHHGARRTEAASTEP